MLRGRSDSPMWKRGKVARLEDQRGGPRGASASAAVGAGGAAADDDGVVGQQKT